MKTAQKMELRASEIRTRLSELAGMDDQTDETRAEIATLRTEYADVERRYQAAVTADDTPPETVTDTKTEDVEMRALIDGSNVGRIFDATLNHAVTDGQERELQTHLNLDPNQVPLAMLETRAVSPAPADVGQQQQPIIPYVFPDGVAAFLGVDMPTVGVGEPVFPVLTSGAVVDTPAENAIPTGTGIDSEGHSTAAFSADVLSPSRIQASFFYSREDRARFAGMDESLRENLSMALSDGLDDEILTGTTGCSREPISPITTGRLTPISRTTCRIWRTAESTAGTRRRHPTSGLWWAQRPMPTWVGPTATRALTGTFWNGSCKSPEASGFRPTSPTPTATTGNKSLSGAECGGIWSRPSGTG